MRNLVLAVLSTAIFFALTGFVYASEQFATDVVVEYSIDGEGKTKVVHDITIENLTTEFYAKSYTLSLVNIQPHNVTATEGNRSLIVNTNVSNDFSEITVDFGQAVVGRGKKRNFQIYFEEDSFISKTGEIWEVAIPKLSSEESFRKYNVKLIIPDSLGKEAYVSPQPSKIEDQSGVKEYYFDKNAVATSGISAGFGDFQVFSFTLKYHLENPLVKGTSVEIAIPPDTTYQKLYYENISPSPTNVLVDDDGNWLASYELLPRQKLDIVVNGSVQIFSGARRDFVGPSEELLFNNTLPSKFWQSKDPGIMGVASELEGPKDIYNYVTGLLDYDYQRIGPEVDRKGALAALDSPKSSICMEFTDLFIALSRAKGIPAREINGFAYTENPEIEPLSLVNDVLHSWPEYWDSQKKMWVPVDPTWGDTTGGVDFFNKLDLRHFVFVIHGGDPEKPYAPGSYKLGPNPQKDVFVNFGELPKQRVSRPQISATVKSSLPLMPTTLLVSISNPGPVTILNILSEVSLDSEKRAFEKIDLLPPFATYKFAVDIPFSDLWSNSPGKVIIRANGAVFEFNTIRNQTLIQILIIFLALVGIVTLLVLIKFKKIKFPNLVKFKSRHVFSSK